MNDYSDDIRSLADDIERAAILTDDEAIRRMLDEAVSRMRITADAMEAET